MFRFLTLWMIGLSSILICGEGSSEKQLLNEELSTLRSSLKKVYAAIDIDRGEEISETSAQERLNEIRRLKEEITKKERQFYHTDSPEESCAYLHASNTSLEQLIFEHVSSRFLYVIPPEMTKIPVNISSSIPIPESSLEEVIEMICLENGIGIKPVNTFVKMLFWISGNQQTSLKYITNQADELEGIPTQQRICFFLRLNGSDAQGIYSFVKKFVNEKQTSLHLFGNDLVLTGPNGDVRELLKLMSFLRENTSDYSYRLFPLHRLSADELKSILHALFHYEPTEARKNFSAPPLTMLPVQEYLLVFGSERDLETAQNAVREIYESISSPEEISIYRYACKYSDPRELASLLQQVYQVMIHRTDREESSGKLKPTPAKKSLESCRQGTNPPICDPPTLVVNPQPIAPKPLREGVSSDSLPNFIVDDKNGLIILAVKKKLSEPLRELIRELDVPKKMVRIEVLLFEKRISDQTQFGLNLLQLADSAKNENTSGLQWKADKADHMAVGILDYFFGRQKMASFPAFNFAYRFLTAADNIHIHSNPTVTAINQTPAVIDLVEEQSVDMGTVEDPRTGTTSKTFVRAQYGIFISITPTVNEGKEEDGFKHYVTLDTDITFDTKTGGKNDRPDVARRHIRNQVRIENGETLILGGLRRKNTEDHDEKIPFLGDIPGLGKLFGYTSLSDKSSEMFIFITPRIVEDPLTEEEKKRTLDLKKRAGDSPEFLQRLQEAKQTEKQ